MAAKPKTSSLLSLEDQFAFYGSYHTNKINIIIHVICVPLILQTWLVLAHYFPHPTFFSFAVPLPGHSAPLQLDVNPPFLYAAAYAFYFILLEPFAGLLYAPILLGMGHAANVFYDTNPEAMKLAGIAFTGAWVAQFIGHGAFEGRAPALLTNLVQSIVLAVFFVFLEVLFLAGYRPALHRRLQNRIGAAVLEYRQSQEAKTKSKAH